MTKPKKKAVSRTQKGALTVPETKEKDLTFAELRDRVSREPDRMPSWNGPGSGRTRWS
jgi:hypothetical protein